MIIPKVAVGALALLDRRTPTEYDNAVSVPVLPATTSVAAAPPSFTEAVPPPPAPAPASSQAPEQQQQQQGQDGQQGQQAQQPDVGGACSNPRVRREWRNFSTQEKQSYISAVQCLKNLPPRGKEMFPVVNSRFDDFLVTHYSRTFDEFEWEGSKHFFGDSDIHENGLFLPWHRYFLWLYESALINECGYQGAQPYWEWSQDVAQNGASWASAPVFEPVNGFGGNGVGDDQCLADGPFAAAGADMDPGPPTDNVITGHPRCFKRGFDLSMANNGLGWNEHVMPLINANSYQDFSYGMDINQSDDFRAGRTSQKFGIHVVGHMAVGGEMADTMVSPTDPLFYLHHANLDRIWWMWQNKKPENVMAVGWQIFFKKSGYAVDMTLDTTLDMYPFLAPNVPARQVMDPMNKDGQGTMCYVYEKGVFDVPWTVAGQ